MTVYDDLAERIRQVAEIQKTAGGARSADAARLVSDYITLRANFSPRPADAGRLEEMHREEAALLNRVNEFLKG